MDTQQPRSITKYNSAAREAILGRKELIVQFNTDCENGLFPKGELNNMRVGVIEDAIRAIETATGQPGIRSITAERPK